MTQEEYKLVCQIIDGEIKTEHISMFYQKRLIDIGGVKNIKEKIKKLVKERK